MQDVLVILLGFSCQAEGSRIQPKIGQGESSKDWRLGHKDEFQTCRYYPEGPVNGSYLAACGLLLLAGVQYADRGLYGYG